MAGSVASCAGAGQGGGRPECEPGPAAPLTFPQARQLLHRPYSCLVLDSRRRHLALSPMYLHRKRSGIDRQLRTQLLRYSESFQGVPIAYDEVKLVGELGSIYDEQGYIHVNIEANFVIFKPEQGKKLVGVVNKVAPSHLGCVVHGCFNASIPKPYHANGAWPGFEAKVGDSVQFEVVHLDADIAGVLCIRGKLDPNSVHAEYSAESEKTLENNNNEAPLENSSNETPLEDDDNHTSDQTPGKTKKKKKKDKRKNDDEFSTQDTPEKASKSIDYIDLSLLEVEVSEPNGKKSKKKKKRAKEEKSDSTQDTPEKASKSIDYIDLSLLEDEVSEPSGKKSKKKKKRAKEEKSDTETEIQTNDFSVKPSKKKKIKHSERFSEATDCTSEPKVKKRRKQIFNTHLQCV